VWTGFTSDGDNKGFAMPDPYCFNWNSPLTGMGYVGIVNFSRTDGTWADSGSVACSSNQYMYCIEQ